MSAKSCPFPPTPDTFYVVAPCDALPILMHRAACVAQGSHEPRFEGSPALGLVLGLRSLSRYTSRTVAEVACDTHASPGAAVLRVSFTPATAQEACSPLPDWHAPNLAAVASIVYTSGAMDGEDGVPNAEARVADMRALNVWCDEHSDLAAQVVATVAQFSGEARGDFYAPAEHRRECGALLESIGARVVQVSALSDGERRARGGDLAVRIRFAPRPVMPWQTRHDVAPPSRVPWGCGITCGCARCLEFWGPVAPGRREFGGAS